MWKQRHDVTCSQMAADSYVIPPPKRKHIQPSVNSQVCGGSPILVCFIFPYVFYQFPSLLLSFITVFYSPCFSSFRLRQFFTGIPRYTRSHFTRFRYNAIKGKKKAVRKLYSNFAVTVYGGGVTAWRAHQLVTSYQYQCEREC